MARYRTFRLFDFNLDTPPKLREKMCEAVATHYAGQLDFLAKKVTGVLVQGVLEVTVRWEDLEEEG